jgi:hypothetical protein
MVRDAFKTVTLTLRLMMIDWCLRPTFAIFQLYRGLAHWAIILNCLMACYSIIICHCLLVNNAYQYIPVLQMKNDGILKMVDKKIL